MSTYRGVPYRPPQIEQADTSLGFDPSIPYTSPEQGALQANVMDSSMRLQDAMAAQQTAGNPTGPLSSPVVQMAVPAALTALSAIFPRHMAIAGPIGMNAFNSLNQNTMIQGRMRQAQASDTVHQAQDDFNRQRFKYALSQMDIDPTERTAIEQRANFDLKGAMEAADAATAKSAQLHAFQTNVGNATAHPLNLQPGQTVRYEAPGQSFSQSGGPELGADMQLLQREHPGETLEQLLRRKADATEQPSAFKWYATGTPEQKAIAKQYTIDTAQGRAEGQDAQMLAEVEPIADQAILGKAPPVVGGGFGAKYNLALERMITQKGGNYAELVNKWNAVQDYVKSMTSERQQIMRQAIKTTGLQLNSLEEAVAKWQQIGAMSGYRDWNKLSLDALSRLPGDAGAAATALKQQLGDTKLGTNMSLNFGYAMNEGERLAFDQTPASLNADQFKANIDVIRTGLQNRIEGIRNVASYATKSGYPVPDFLSGLETPSTNAIKTSGGGGNSPDGTVVEYKGVTHTKRNGKWDPPFPKE